MLLLQFSKYNFELQNDYEVLLGPSQRFLLVTKSEYLNPARYQKRDFPVFYLKIPNYFSISITFSRTFLQLQVAILFVFSFRFR